jgi:acetyl esterase/lipase
VWLEPVPALVVGELAALAQTAQVDGVRVPGYWLHRPGSDLAYDAPPAPSEKVVLAFHGGSYVVRSANPADPSMGFAHALLAHVPAIQRVLGVEYRLSTSLMGHAPNPFPAALLDALAAYAHLVKVLGVRPADVVLAGSSAGGNLALALVRYLVEHRAALAPAGLGVPGGVVLFSPWADMGTSHAAPLASYFARADWLPAGAYPATVYAGPHGTGFLDTSAYASPASAHLRAPLPSYAGWPRTFIACGSRETFAPMVRTLRDRMAADLGQDRGDGVGPGAVYYYEEADAVHDFASNVRHEPERTRVMKKVAGWIAP